MIWLLQQLEAFAVVVRLRHFRDETWYDDHAQLPCRTLVKSA